MSLKIPLNNDLKWFSIVWICSCVYSSLYTFLYRHIFLLKGTIETYVFIFTQYFHISIIEKKSKGSFFCSCFDLNLKAILEYLCLWIFWFLFLSYAICSFMVIFNRKIQRKKRSLFHYFSTFATIFFSLSIYS